MSEFSHNPNFRRATAVLALGGLAFLGGCGAGAEQGKETAEVYTTITIPEVGPIDTVSEAVEAYCERSLDAGELDEATKQVMFDNRMSTGDVMPGDKLIVEVGMCDKFNDRDN